MAVLMASRNLAVHKRGPGVLDAHGEPVGGAWDGPQYGPWPGRATEQSDGAWALAVDPDAWPLKAGDMVVDVDRQQRWLVIAATLLTNNLDSSVNYVRVDAREREGAATEVPSAPPPTTYV